MEVIKQSSNYVVEHGEYISDWKDEKGHIFERTMVLTDGMVELMLREAIAGFIIEESVTELTDGWRNKDRDPFLYQTKMQEVKPQQERKRHLPTVGDQSAWLSNVSCRWVRFLSRLLSI